MTGRCEFEQSYVDFDGSSASMPCSQEATWLVWSPPRGQQYEDPKGAVGSVCGDHLLVVQDEEPDVEVVQIATLPMRCDPCGATVWAKHSHPHATGQRCDFCQQAEAEHPACSCPVEAEYLRAMETAS